jgi:hypothetical protein
MTTATPPARDAAGPYSTRGEHDMTNQNWWPYERLMLPRSALVIERYDGTDGYQRNYRQRFVDAAVRDFREARFQALTVAPIIDGRHRRPGFELFAILDGQHRFGMAEALGLDPVPCDVYCERMTYQERALEFYSLNHAKQMINVTDGVRALYEAEDEELLSLLYLLERHRFYLHGFRPSHVNGHRALHATHTLQTAYARDARALEAALIVLQPWQDIINRRHERLVIGALMMWCKRDAVDLERLSRVLTEHGPDHLVRDAGEIAARVGRANPTPEHLANAIREVYNRNLRSRRIDEPF